MELEGQNICPTTFAPHVWHLKGKLGANLPHLPHHPNRPQVVYQAPGEEVLEFFDSIGFRCPERKGVADFLQEVCTVLPYFSICA
jgi:hypothetical protein